MVKSRQNGQPEFVPVHRMIAAMREHGLDEEHISTVVEAASQPETLLTLPQAAEEFGIPLPTVEGWFRRGHLRERGSERFHAPGGRRHLVDQDDVAYLIKHPPKPTGRPPKNGGKSNGKGLTSRMD